MKKYIIFTLMLPAYLLAMHKRPAEAEIDNPFALRNKISTDSFEEILSVEEIVRMEEWVQRCKATDALFDALHSADCSANFYEEIQRLLNAGADLSQIYCTGMTSLVIAATRGDAYLFDMLLSAGADITQYCNEEPIIYYICSDDNNNQNRVYMLQKALSKYQELGCTLPENQWDMLLGNAIVNNCAPEILITLINAGANPNYRTDVHQTPLFKATIKGNISFVRTLLKYPSVKQSINDRDRLDWTALVYACYGNHTDIALELLRAGSVANIQCNGGLRSPLLGAIKNSNHQLARLLITCGAQCDDQTRAKLFNAGVIE